MMTFYSAAGLLLCLLLVVDATGSPSRRRRGWGAPPHTRLDDVLQGLSRRSDQKRTSSFDDIAVDLSGVFGDVDGGGDDDDDDNDIVRSLLRRSSQRRSPSFDNIPIGLTGVITEDDNDEYDNGDSNDDSARRLSRRWSQSHHAAAADFRPVLARRWSQSHHALSDDAVPIKKKQSDEEFEDAGKNDEEKFEDSERLGLNHFTVFFYFRSFAKLTVVYFQKLFNNNYIKQQIWFI